MTNDDDDVAQDYRLLRLWAEADADTEKLIDRLLICICGWSFQTLLKKAIRAQTLEESSANNISDDSPNAGG